MAPKLKVFIIGLGLIGASLGLNLRDSSRVVTVMGFDQNPDTRDQAIDMGVIDYWKNIADGAREADVIFLCTPLGSYREILANTRIVLRPGTIISDVGSTKEEVMKLFQDLPAGVWAIGGHPMAGSEIKGLAGADRYLFENAVYCLTPGPQVPAEVLESLIDILAVTGARIRIMEAAVHDELVAAVSHIPHLAAVALVNLTQGREGYLMLAAGGFRDTTRIASSHPEIWNDILLFNRHHILDKLDELIANLQDIKQALVQSNFQHLNEELWQAKAIRDQIPRAHRGLIPSFHDIVCIVPDKPGIIGQLGFILGQEGINIVDIEILRVREGDGGTIRLGVPSEAAARKAVTVLKDHGIKAWQR
ncbi:MAG: prephenate dehydrogenase [Syntrophomonadaceae bacterium]|nr:prephenate dehydrogenase [Syntrophomonadaceae bacterium]